MIKNHKLKEKKEKKEKELGWCCSNVGKYVAKYDVYLFVALV
jgi:hypothetical protein